MSRSILIAGATGSGKSALALALAERFDGTIVNCDSMQVYSEMRVLTARPTPQEETRVPHKLYGHVPAREPYSVARYVDDSSRAIAEVCASGRIPIIVGGTGLYLKALLEGLSPIPNIPAEIRAYWRRQGEEVEAGTLHALLAARDPTMAGRLAPTDIQRIVRALEVLDSTGRSLAEWQQARGVPVLHEDESLRLVVRLERADLHRRCDSRLEAMIAGGALAEAEAMAALRLDPGLPAMRAIGLRPLMAHVAGKIGLSDALRLAQAETRQYVKRQDTWMRRHFVSWTTIFPQQMEFIEPLILPFIDSKR